MKRYIKASEDSNTIYFYIKEYKNNIDISEYFSVSIRNINRVAKAEFDNDPRYHVYVVSGIKSDYEDLKQKDKSSNLNSDFLSQYNIIIPDDGYDSNYVSEEDTEYYMNTYNERKDKENREGLQGNLRRNYRL